ncbi:hypothetical protein [Pseudidiomarina sp. YC-516-91]|uniref:hypothetical protein n=1 Tax=Pseudidiomarina salilacus TaxID=3384452 RepID=UPI0039853ABA
MTNMFKRSLVALAIAGASTGAMAADVTLTETTSATDQFMTTMSEILSKNIIITLNDEFSVNDEIYLRFEGDAYISNAPNSVDIAFGEQFDEAGGILPIPASAATSLDDVNKGISLDFKGQMTDDDGNTVLIYRVSDIVGDNSSATNDTTYGVQVDFGRLHFDAPTVVAQDGVMFDTFSRLNSELWPTVAEGDEMFDHDAVTAPMIDETQLFVMGDQFEISVLEEFNGTLNVWDYRRTFVNDDPIYNGEVLNVPPLFTDNVQARIQNTQSPLGGAWDFRVNVDPNQDTQVLYKIVSTNMFGWIESADPTVGGEVVINSPNCDYVTHTADQLWISCPNLFTTLDFDIDLGATADSYQNPKQAGEFTVTGDVNWYNFDELYEDAPASNRDPEDGILVADPTGMSTVDSVYGGEWEVNGSMTTIPYMPYSAQSASGEVTPISQIIYVTNTTRDPGTDDPLICNDPQGNDSCNGEGPAPQNPNVNRLIWVEGIDENGDEFGPVELTTTADPGVTGIAGEIREILFGQGMLNTSNKVSLTVTVADYPTNIQVYSAYNVNGSDRGWVQNDSIRTDIDVYNGNEILD